MKTKFPVLLDLIVALFVWILATASIARAEMFGGLETNPPSGEVHEGETFRAFEFRAVSADPRANGETDFKGATATMSTGERVAFLKAYADFAAAWFGAPQLDQWAVKPGEAERHLDQIKPQPLTSVRQTRRLNDGWRQLGVPASRQKTRDQPWRTPRGVALEDGELVLPPGTTEILDLAQSSGWRYELRWGARGRQSGGSASWRFGAVQPPKASRLTGAGWHRFRFQADLVEKRGYLSRDGERVAEFPLTQPAGKPAPLGVVCGDPVGIRNLVFIDYREQRNPKQPYAPVVLADADFKTRPPTKDWNTLSYDDKGWAPAPLPCVHGGFLEAGEDLYLRRVVELPAARRVWLEVEALDPSGEIYVNGRLAGLIPNRLPILLDVTALAGAGANVIAFKVNPNWIEDPSPHAPADRAIGWFAGRTTLYLLPGDVAIRELLVNTLSLDKSGNARQTHRLMLENAGDQPFGGALEISYRPWFPNPGATVYVNRVSVRLPAHSSHQVVADMDLPGAVVHQILTQPVFAGSDDVDTVYGPGDIIRPCVFNLGPARNAVLVVTVETPDGRLLDRRTFPDLRLEAGRSLLRLPAYRPKFPPGGYCAVEYTVRTGR